jgi:hypothetical protein
MSHSSPHEEPFSEAHLDCPEYRERLMRKLNCLIAVLEVATAKVKKSLAGTDADVERLARIRNNLESTLEVCLRARAALERRQALPRELAHNLGLVIGDSHELQKRPLQRQPPLRVSPLAPGARVEMLSGAEHEKFESLGRIDKRALAAVDLDELARRLQS